MKARSILFLFLLTAGIANSQANNTNEGVRITPLEGRVRIEIHGNLFTEYFFKEVLNPYCYPMIGPAGVGMTRNWPMKTVPDEERDHPHHRSFWYARGLSGLTTTVQLAAESLALPCLITPPIQDIQPPGTPAITDSSLQIHSACTTS